MLEAPSKPSYRLPVGLLQIWTDDHRVLHRLADELAAKPGYRLIKPDVLATTPVRGDPDVIGAAVAAGRRLVERLSAGGPPESEPARVRLLVRPAEMEISEDRAEIVQDRMFADLRDQPPDLPGGLVHLTSRAALNLEQRHSLELGTPYHRPSGRVVSTLVAGAPSPAVKPWRNLEIWGRETRWHERVEEEAFAGLLDTPAFRVTGPLGSGKTRATIRALSKGSRSWFRITPAYPRGEKKPIELALLEVLRRRLPLSESSIREEIDAYLASNPSWGDLDRSLGLILAAVTSFRRAGSESIAFVFDSLERAMSADWEAVTKLAANAGGEGFQLILCSRSGLPWLPSLARLPEIALQPLPDATSEKVLDTLLSGLSLPAPVRQRLLDAGGGHPFALEEGVIGLIQRRQIRRFFGTFVFKGSESTPYRPSPRWVRHVEAEAHRIGNPLPLRLLAPVSTPVPPLEAASAGALVGEKIPARWEEPFLEAGWLKAGTGPWGDGVEIVAGAIRIALDSTLAPASRDALRRSLGEILSVLGGGGHWQAYHLLAGDPDAIPILLQVAGDSRRAGETHGLVDALVAELKNHREREGDQRLELELLWKLLPAARNDDRLGDLIHEVDRALELAEGQPKKLLALAALKADHEQKGGRLREAEETLQQALQLSGSTDEPQKAMLLVQLGRLMMRQDRNLDATRLFEKILPMLERLDLRSLIGSCYFYLGNIALAQNQAGSALELHQKALTHRRQLGNPKAMSPSLSALGAVHIELGRYRQALAYYSEAETAAKATEDSKELSFVLLGVGRTLNRLGDHGAAAGPLRQCLEIRQKLSDPVGEALANLAVAANYLAMENPGQAQEHAQRAVFGLRLVTGSNYLGRAERMLGQVRLMQRRPDEAQQHFENALQKHLESGDSLAASYARAWLIRTGLESGETSELTTLAKEISKFLESGPYPELGERLDFEVFRALERLDDPESENGDRLFHLQRAHKGLMEKTGHLDSEQRNRFLLQIPQNAAILAAATRCGL